MKVSLSKQFSDQLNELAAAFEQWSEEGRKRLVKAHRKIGQRHRTEAVKRVPVDESSLRQRIITKTHVDASGTEVLTETGTNVREYPIYLEFGTRYIAGGRVLALGEDVRISDAEAVHDWPAKRAEADQSTRFSYSAGSPQEQMPWLRTAFNKIRYWAVQKINEAFVPPKQRKV